MAHIVADKTLPNGNHLIIVRRRISGGTQAWLRLIETDGRPYGNITSPCVISEITYGTIDIRGSGPESRYRRVMDRLGAKMDELIAAAASVPAIAA